MLLRLAARLIPVFSFLTIAFAGSPAKPLRIASFNLEWLVASANETDMAPWHDETALEKHRRNLARILADDVHADIVCVLESTSQLALEKLVAEPKLKPLHYRIYHLESEDVTTGQDVAFLVRVPLDRVDGNEINDFRTNSRNGSRDPLTKRAVIYLTSGKLKLGLLGMHLLAHPDDAKRTRKREAQAKVAAQIVRDDIVAKGYMPIVLGDFNDFDSDVKGPGNEPHRKVLHILKDFDPEKSGDELFNAAEKIQPASARYSAYWDLNKDEKWDDNEPRSMLDHILLDQSLKRRLLTVKILHVPSDGSVSDHWPVVVDLKR